MHVESVAWVAECKDLLSTFFTLLTIGAYLWYVRCLKAEHGRPLEQRIATAVAWYLPVFLLFALTLMAKPMPLTLPCLLLLLDYWPLERLTLRAVLKQHAAVRKEPEISRAARARAVRSQPLRHRQEVIRTREWRWKAALWLVAEKLPLLALSAASSRITYLAQQKGASMAKLESLPFALRLCNVLTAYLRYIGGMIWPFDLTMFYPYQTQLDATYVTYAVIAAEVLLVITCIAVAGAFYGRRYLAVGWFWFLGTLVPVIGLVQVGDQSMADRYSYFTFTGLFIMLVWGAADLLERWRPGRAVLIAAAVAVLAGCAVLAAGVRGYWPGSATGGYVGLAVFGALLVGVWLTTHLMERRSPGCSTAAAKALTVLAAALVAAAISVLLVAAVPWLAKHVLPTAIQAGHWQDLALGRYWGSALVALVIIVAWGAADLLGRWLGSRVVLGAAAAAVLAGCVLLTVIQASYWQDTTTALEHTLIVAPDNPAAENNLGVTMWERAQGTRGAKPESEEQIAEYRKKAIEHWRNAVRIRPQFSDALNNLGCALRQRDAEFDVVERALAAAIQKGDAKAAATFRARRDVLEAAYNKQLEEAATCFRAAIKYKPEHSDAHSNLGLTVWQLTKQPEEPIKEFTRALELRPDHADAHVTFANVLMQMAEAAAKQHKPKEAARRLDEAADHVSKVIHLDERNARAFMLLGQIRQSQQNFPEAALARSRAAWLMATSPRAATRNGLLAVNLSLQALGISGEQKSLEAVIQQVLGTTGEDPRTLDILAAALAELGRFADARQVAEKALAVANQRGEAPLAAALRFRLQLYQNGQKFRDAGPESLAPPAGT